MHDSVTETKVQLSQDIFPAEAWELITKNRDADDLVIIDVSTPQEYKDLHLEGAINVNLLSRFFKTRLDVMNKSKTYVVYCKVGGRSKIAQKLMQQFGFRTVYNVVGGTLLWEEEGLPFASGTEGVNKFSFCPFFISIVTFKKIKKVLHNGLSRIVQPKGGASFVDLALIPLRILLLEGSWSIFPRDPSLNRHSSSAHFSRSDHLQPGLHSLWDFHL
jgi:rhodanese-related sulfurtransferase